MKAESGTVLFSKLEKGAEVPYELLLLADPSRELVDGYLRAGEVFVAKRDGVTRGVVVLLPLTAATAEIKNIAVLPEWQGKGIGSFLIENTVKEAALRKYQSIQIGTANSSVGQLYLYQKHGFEICGVKWGFFEENYPEPIFENGIRARHLLILSKVLP